MSRRKGKPVPLRVRAEEVVGGINVVWTAGLPSSLKAFVRTCVQRYPDLLACERLVIGWNTLGGDWPALVTALPVGCRGSMALFFVKESWYRYGSDRREMHFLIDLFSIALTHAGRLRPSPGGDLQLYLSDGRILTTADTATFIEVIVLGHMEARAQFGGET